jgi:FkbM family methyltransferase
MSAINQMIRHQLRKAGLDIIRDAPLVRRQQLLQTYEINLVIDVGANSGQYVRELRKMGYRGKIVSFEPLYLAYVELKRRAADDPLWLTYNFALGDKRETAFINIAGNSYSSSIRAMLPSHLAAAPESRYIGQEEIFIEQLDSWFSELSPSGANILLKIDTQGFEANVLRGAESSLDYIDTIQLELSLIPLYDGEVLIEDMLKMLRGQGYRIVSLEPGFADPKTGELLQVDGILHRVRKDQQC